MKRGPLAVAAVLVLLVSAVTVAGESKQMDAGGGAPGEFSIATQDQQTSPQVVLDELVKNLTYDGLGRLVRVQSPYPDPSAANGELRTGRFHYEGIRRIQEVLTDPLLDTDGAADGGETAAMSALLEEPQLDGSAVTLGSESNQTDGGGPGGGGTPTPAPPAAFLEREYIWGPGDWGGGLDELLVQFDRQRDPWWVVQDAGLDAIAVCDLGGSGGAARVVWQGTYDAYGAVLSAESLYAHAHTRIGHKGLFFDRLDGGVVEQYTLAETPRLAAGARLAGHVRNRILLPDLGRFAQADPNATGAMLLASAHGGSGLDPSISVFDLQGLYGDGGNLYEYVGTNPWTSSDPLGLSAASFFLPGPGDMITGALQGLVQAYSANLDWDVGWAADWSTGDDWHTRLDNTWIPFAMLQGIYDSFEIGIPFTEIGFNPLDAWAAAASRTPKSRFHTRWGVAGFARTVEWNGYRATVYNNPRAGRKLVMFDKDAVSARVRVTPHNHKKEVAEANQKAGFGNTTPDGKEWHHHWESGVMYLVPQKLHRLVGHIGRAQGWAPERFP